jgi:hypothetical protein
MKREIETTNEKSPVIDGALLNNRDILDNLIYWLLDGDIVHSTTAHHGPSFDVYRASEAFF